MSSSEESSPLLAENGAVPKKKAARGNAEKDGLIRETTLTEDEIAESGNDQLSPLIPKSASPQKEGTPFFKDKGEKTPLLSGKVAPPVLGRFVTSPGQTPEPHPHMEERRRQRNYVEHDRQSTSELKSKRVRNITRKITVEPVVLLFYVSFNASTPVMQQYLYERFTKEYLDRQVFNVFPNLRNLTLNSGNNSCEVDPDSFSYIVQQNVQAQTARYMVIMALACVLPALFTTVFLGAYSDSAGRKVAMIPALFGEALRMGVNALVIYFNLPLWICVLAIFIDGALGSAGGVMMAAFAYLSDITTHKQRTTRIVILELCMGFGVTASQLGIGHMIVQLGYFWPMFTIAVVNIVNFFYVLFFLPESLEKDPDAKFFTSEHFSMSTVLYTVDDWKCRRWKLQLTLLMLAVATTVELGTTEVTTLFLLNSPFCWDAIFIGYYNGLNFVVKNFGAVVILKTLLWRIGDIGTLIIGILFMITYQIYLGFSFTDTMVFCAPVAGLGTQLILPMIRSISSKLVETEEQGALFASQGWMQLLGASMGSTIFNTIYGQTLFIHHGMTFFSAAAMMIIPLVCASVISWNVRREKLAHDDFEERRAAVDEYFARKKTLLLRTGSILSPY